MNENGNESQICVCAQLELFLMSSTVLDVVTV